MTSRRQSVAAARAMGAQIVGFLQALRAQLKRKLLIVWDGAAQHKSRSVRGYLDSTKGALQMAPLSP